MNNEHTEESLLKQVDDLLDSGKTSDSALLNDLASMIPEADISFQNQLEARLVEQLWGKPLQKKKESALEPTLMTPTTRRPTPSFPIIKWAAIVLIVLGGGYVLFSRPPRLETAIPLPIQEKTHRIVVATKYLTDGDFLFEGMFDVVDLPESVFEKLQYNYPGETFYTDLSQVYGRQAVMPVNPLEPILPRTFGLEKSNCGLSESYGCVYNDYEINLPLPQSSIAEALTIGDRVDVLVDLSNPYLLQEEGGYTAIDDVQIVDVQKDYITLAAPAWKYSLLAWHIRTNDQSYTLHPHKDNKPAGWDDQSVVEYTLRTLAPLTETEKISFYVRVPLSEAYLLSGPASMNLAQSWINGDEVEFTFSNIQLARAENESTFVLRMPKGDATNLDFLLSIGADLMVGGGLGSNTLLPNASPNLPAAPFASPTPESDVCPEGQTACLPLPEGYLEISLPSLNIQWRELIEPGNRVDVLGKINGQSVLIVEDVLLMGENTRLVDLAAPAWKYAVLAWYAETGETYTLRAVHNTQIGAWDSTTVQYTLEAPEVLPGDYAFDLVVRLPNSEGHRLINMPYSLDETPFTTNGDMMSFWFKKLLKVSTSGTTAIIELAQSDAANLDALIEMGAELIFQPDANPPTATPADIEIPQGRVAMRVTSSEPLPDAEQFDVLVTMKGSDVSPAVNDPKNTETIVFRNTNGEWEFRFTDMVVVRTFAPGSIDPAILDPVVTFHLLPQDAIILQYLLDSGAQTRIVAKGEAMAEATPTAIAQAQECIEAACRKESNYYKIKLPLSDFTVPYAVRQGERVDIARSAPEMTIEHVILLDINDESVTVAAPAWKYSLLLWLSQLEGPASYTINSSDGLSEGTVVEPLAPATIAFSTDEYLPQVFMLRVTLPESQISRLIDLPYYGIASSFQDGILHFWFRDIEMVSQNADSSYTIRLPAGSAANLEYLISLGAEINIAMAMEYLPTPALTPLPTFTPTFDPAEENLVIPAAIANRPCPPEAQHCVPVPDDYYQIRLPLPTVPATGLWFETGDRIELWINPNDRDRLIVENVLFVGTDRESLIFAAPAWKYAVLFSFLETDWPIEYTMRPFDGTNFPILATSDLPTMYTLNNLPIASETFDLMVKVPPAKIEELASVPYLINGADSVISEGVLYFFFPELEKSTTYSDSSYVVALSSDQAAALDYLRTIGGEMQVSMPSTDSRVPTPAPTWTPTFTPMPTFTPVAAPNDEVAIPQDRTAVSLPSKSALPNATTFDIIVSVPHDKPELMTGISESLNRLPFQINIDTWDIQFTDVELIDIYEPGSVDSAQLDTIVRFHVKRRDAGVLEYLVGNGATVKFVPGS